MQTPNFPFSSFIPLHQISIPAEESEHSIRFARDHCLSVVFVRMCVRGCASLTQGREVVGTKGGSRSAATGTTTGGTSTRSATGSATLATGATTVATRGATAGSATTVATVTAVTTVAATATSTAATGRAVLAGTGVVLPCDGLLDLLVLELLGLASGGGKVVLLIGLGQGGAFGLVLDLADLEGLVEGQRGGALGEVGVQSDLLDLGLLGLLSLLGVGISLLGLGNGLASLLVLQLGIAVGGTPSLGSLLLGTAAWSVLGGRWM